MKYSLFTVIHFVQNTVHSQNINQQVCFFWFGPELFPHNLYSRSELSVEWRLFEVLAWKPVLGINPITLRWRFMSVYSIAHWKYCQAWEESDKAHRIRESKTRKWTWPRNANHRIERETGEFSVGVEHTVTWGSKWFDHDPESIAFLSEIHPCSTEKTHVNFMKRSISLFLIGGPLIALVLGHCTVHCVIYSWINTFILNVVRLSSR